MLDEALAHGAEDLHLAAVGPAYMRVDGTIRPLAGDAGPTLRQLLAQAGLAANGEAADWAFSHGAHRVRAHLYYSRRGAHLSLRFLPEAVPTMEALGLPDAFSERLAAPRGLVIVSGPTGSGKSTTLAAFTAALARAQLRHILTYESPIEYLHDPALFIEQIELPPDALAAAVQGALRADPDVLVIGEVRHAAEMEAALSLAETGHLVLLSLHATRALDVPARVLDFFPAERASALRHLLADSLALVCSQRLVPRIGGGRIGLYETWQPGPADRHLLREGKTQQIHEESAAGYRSLERAAALAVARGSVAESTVLPLLERPALYQRLRLDEGGFR